MLDYINIVKNLQDKDIITLMEKLGVTKYVEKDNEIIFPTVCHNDNPDEASMKLYYYKNNKFFYCYTECGAMNVFSFLEHFYQTRQIEYNWYEDVYSVITNCTSINLAENFNSYRYESISDKYIKNKPKKLEIYPETVLDTFIKYYPVEWLTDGILRESMDKFNIRYSIGQNKIIIPHYDVNNNLIGIRGRALDPWEIKNIGKYMPVQIENKWYSHHLSMNLYGLNFNKDSIRKNKICYVFESEKAVLQCESFNEPNCAVAVCGSNFNKYQLQILLKECYPDEIIICFDNEEKDGQDKYFYKLLNICKKYNKYCNFSFIYDRINLTNKKDSPSDHGEKIFKELLEKRVRVFEI